MRQPNEVWQKAALFASLWEEIYSEKFVITGMELRWAKELRDVDNDLIVQRFQIFKEDEWYRENTGHSLPSFVKNFNTFVKKTKRRDGTWKTEPDAPIEEVRKLFEPTAQALGAPQRLNPNDKYRCKDCHEVHSPNLQCQ